jgi:hypothetical protein
MSAREILQYQTTTPIKLLHPTDTVNQNTLDTTNDGSTCSFKVFDANKESVLTADEAGAQTVISVDGPAKFDVGDTVEIPLDSGSIHSANIDSIELDDGTVTINTGLPSQASAGKRIKAILGSEVTMDEYGTPKIGTRDWGFIGTIESDHPGLIPDLEIDIEITFIGAVLGDLNRFDVIRAVVKELDE